MKIIKILSLICFLTIGISAQTGATVEGRITLFGIAVKDTGITLYQPGKTYNPITTRTDESGRYHFENVPLGKYILNVSTVVPDVVTVTSVDVNLKRQETKIVNLELAARDQNLGNVSISAGTQQTIEQISKTVDTIDAQEMRDRADFALVESLKTIPGFRVQQLGGFGRTANIKTRGLRNQDTAVLIDGIRFRDASSLTGDASAFLSDFTLTSVSKIEVLRGSGSSLYGTNAIGGVIDFQTPKPQEGFHGQIGGAAGGYGLGRFRGNISDGNERFGFNLGVSRTVYTKGIDGEDNAHNTNFQSRIEYNPFQKTNISARFFVSDAYVRLNSNPDTIGALPATNATIINAVPLARDLVKRLENGQPVTSFGNANFVPDLNERNVFQKSQFFNGQLVLTQVLNDRLVFQGYYSGLKTARRNTNRFDFGDADSIFDGIIQTANAHLNFTPNKSNQVTFGYEFEDEKFGNDGVTPFAEENFFTRAGQSSNTLYAQDLISLLNGSLQIAGGFRAQFFSLKNARFSLTNAPYSNLTLENPPTAYTFDGAASYFFQRTGTKLRAHAGNGYRVPSLYERFGTFYSTFIAPAFIALGDPNLSPEKTIAFDAGVEQNLFENRVKLSATYFYTKLLDTIGYGDVVPAIGTTQRPFGGYINTKGGIARGAEFSAKARAARSTDLFASYTFTNSDQRAPQVTGNPNLQTLGIPLHQFTVVATRHIGRAWINFDFLATSSYLAPIFDTNNFTFRTYVYRFKGNRKADLTGGYTFAFRNEKLNLRLFGTIENLFDYDYYENGFRTFGRNGRIGLSFGF